MYTVFPQKKCKFWYIPDRNGCDGDERDVEKSGNSPVM